MQSGLLCYCCIMVTARPVVVIALCISSLQLFVGCKNVDSRRTTSSNSLDCFDESRFNSTQRWNVSINEQEELNDFVDSVTSVADDKDRCIQLLLTGNSYALDIIKIMRIKLGTGGGLVIVGVAKPLVTINCIANFSDLEELKKELKPLASISLVVLDGLLFAECPVPVVLEEVSTVIVQNCVFM